MTRKIELLAPGGDIEAIKAGIAAGADAVYCGLDVFNARNRASNLSIDELAGAVRLAHEYNCKVFLTLNIVILEHEIDVLIKLLNQIVNLKIDGIIVQDLGVFDIVKKYFPTIAIHASTQMTTHNEGQIHFLKRIGASRINLSRELNLSEIKSLTAVAHEHGILTEVFVHGALCIAFSGQCYSSSVSVGNSGNRGRCSQACRDEYEETAAGNKYPLNLKDNSAYFNLPELVDAHVDSLKIEGRIKDAHYVYTVTDTWRKQINGFIERGELVNDDSNLHKVFNRSFTSSFLTGNLTKDMFIDNPRDYSAKHAVQLKGAVSAEQIDEARKNLYDDRARLGAALVDKVKHLNTEKTELSLKFTAKLGLPLTVTVSTHSDVFVATSSVTLKSAGISPIKRDVLEKHFKTFNSPSYKISHFDFTELDEKLSLPFYEIRAIKKELAFLLNGSVAVVPNVEIPKPPVRPKDPKSTPRLSLLIHEEKDAGLSEFTDSDIYFKLPESFRKDSTKYADIFLRHPRLIPWFPAVIIGKNYAEAVKLLETLKPAKIAANNTGIAYKAFEMGIDWIAGPFLNTTNSHALVTLKEKLNCNGAFISNEINSSQIKKITAPENFRLLYSIYHPILMMTSRQCFFQRTVGCDKPSIDESCMLRCQKSTTITNIKGVSFAVDKQRGGYPSIYNHEQYLNLDAVRDFYRLFDEFFIDLTDIGSGSKEKLDKRTLIFEFEKFLNDERQSKEFLKNMVPLSTNAQYVTGL